MGIHSSEAVWLQLRSGYAYVAFGRKNGMFIVGHNLVWHSQTPAWVFQAIRATGPWNANASLWTVTPFCSG